MTPPAIAKAIAALEQAGRDLNSDDGYSTPEYITDALVDLKQWAETQEPASQFERYLCATQPSASPSEAGTAAPPADIPVREGTYTPEIMAWAEGVHAMNPDSASGPDAVARAQEIVDQCMGERHSNRINLIASALAAAEKRGADQREAQIKRAFQWFIVRCTHLDPDDSWDGIGECVMSVDAELRSRTDPDAPQAKARGG